MSDEAGETLVKLLDVLDDHDDVQNVYGNYELSDALMAKLGAVNRVAEPSALNQCERKAAQELSCGRPRFAFSASIPGLAAWAGA